MQVGSTSNTALSQSHFLGGIFAAQKFAQKMAHFDSPDSGPEFLDLLDESDMSLSQVSSPQPPGAAAAAQPRWVSETLGAHTVAKPQEHHDLNIWTTTAVSFTGVTTPRVGQCAAFGKHRPTSDSANQPI